MEDGLVFAHVLDGCVIDRTLSYVLCSKVNYQISQKAHHMIKLQRRDTIHTRRNET